MTDMFLDFVPENFSSFEETFRDIAPSYRQKFLDDLLKNALSSKHVFTLEIEGLGILATQSFVERYPEIFIQESHCLKKLATFLEPRISIYRFVGTKPFQTFHSDFWTSDPDSGILTSDIDSLSFAQNEKGYGFCIRISIRK